MGTLRKSKLQVGTFATVAAAIFAFLMNPALAEEIVKTLPGGNADTLLKMNKDPNWKAQESGGNSGMTFTLQCEDTDGRLIGKDQPGYSNCMSTKTNTVPPKKASKLSPSGH